MNNLEGNEREREGFISIIIYFCLSPAYISPDCLSNMPYYGKPNDIWSLGIVFYTMLYGHLPFYDPIPDRLFKKIQSAEFLIPK